MKRNDLTGKRFGRLTVLEYMGNMQWKCKCDCGNIRIIRTDSLTNGRTKSCGCLQKEASGKEADDLTGRKFGRLTAIKRVENKGKSTMWLCQCDCGNKSVVSAGHLKEGATKSCGCLISEKALDLSGMKFGKLTPIKSVGKDKVGRILWLCQCDCGLKYITSAVSMMCGNTMSCGCSRRKYKYSEHKRLYHVWRTMIARCNNPNVKSYKNYGGRGVSVCKEWLGEKGYENFYLWSMNNGYDENAKFGQCTIDRIDNNGNYCPENCRWVDMKVQNNNKKR